MDKFLEKLLKFYNMSEEEYHEMVKPISDISLLDVKTIPNIDAITNRIHSAIVNNEKIIIYGDYDCDGICSTSIVKRTFDILNYAVSYYIPSRYQDGYGLNVDNVHKMAAKGFKLIITVDNGISANEAIDVAKSYGIDVIVVDHHEVPETLPNAIGFIHPIVSKISNIYGSGGYMSLFLSTALLGYYDNYLVTLAGISVVSDLMELKGYNKDVVRLSIYNFNKYKYLPLKLLVSTDVVTEKTYGLEIGPKINSIGRILEGSEPNRLIRYLTTSDKEEIIKTSEWINNVNEERKEIVKSFVDTYDETEIAKLPAVVEICDTKEGIMGLIANRFLTTYNLPGFALAVDSRDPEYLKGSARSRVGFSIVDAFAEPNIKKYLVNGGGHAYAGGLSIKKSDFEPFKAAICEYAKSHPISDSNKPVIEISLNEVTRQNYDILRTFSPFGMGNEEPEFLIKHFKTSELDYITYGKHISTRLGMSTKLMGFNMPSKDVQQFNFVDFRGNLLLSYYKGFESVEFRISSYNESK